MRAARLCGESLAVCQRFDPFTVLWAKFRPCPDGGCWVRWRVIQSQTWQLTRGTKSPSCQAQARGRAALTAEGLSSLHPWPMGAACPSSPPPWHWAVPAAPVPLPRLPSFVEVARCCSGILSRPLGQGPQIFHKGPSRNYVRPPGHTAQCHCSPEAARDNMETSGRVRAPVRLYPQWQAVGRTPRFSDQGLAALGAVSATPGAGETQDVAPQEAG